MKRKVFSAIAVVCIVCMMFLIGKGIDISPASYDSGDGFRNVELQNKNPYAIFGSDAVVLMTEAERNSDHILEIVNDNPNDPISRMELDMRTGIAKIFDKDGKLTEERLLDAKEKARWLTQDRFAEKYYSLSPYSYAAGNPVLIIDINGDSLWIEHKGVRVLHVDGQLYNSDGSSYEGKTNAFIRKATKALGQISETNTGRGMVSTLQSSENNFTIVKGDNRFKASDVNKAYGMQHKTENTIAYQMKGAAAFEGGSGGKILWSPSGASVPTMNGYSNNPAVVLGHEISHAYDANAGRMNNRVVDGLESNEWQAVYRENLMRQDLGLPLRTHYGSSMTSDGVKMGGVGPRVLTPANKPYMPWYK